MFKNRKHGVFAVGEDMLISIPSSGDGKKRGGLTIEDALETIYQQMRISGNRPRTIESYKYIFNQFIDMTLLKYVEEITVDSIYHYLDSLQVSASTKLIRLKSLKAVLSKFFNNGWIKEKFWNNIHIKIDKEVKNGTRESDIEILLAVIDQSTFIGFRDAAAIRLMYTTGIRIRTLGELRESHIDFDSLHLNLDGSIMKNHKYLKLPINEEIVRLARH